MIDVLIILTLMVISFKLGDVIERLDIIIKLLKGAAK